MSENPTIYDGEAGTCLDCGYPLQAVRPGKAQCDYCDTMKIIEKLEYENEDLRQSLAVALNELREWKKLKEGAK